MSTNTPTRGVIRHRVRERLQAMIHSGQIKPGQKLVQRELAKQFNVGQGVVREALLELRGFGLVDSIDNRGMFVGEQSRKRLLESYDVRAMLEALSARLCCQQITRALVRELEHVAHQIFDLASTGKHKEAAHLDREFHLRLVRIAGNQVLISLMSQDQFLTKIAWAPRDPALTRDDHLALLKAIEENRPDDAERMVRAQIVAGRDFIEEHLSGEEAPRWVL